MAIVGCTATVPSSTPVRQRTGSEVVHWKDCGSGFQCGTLSVPLDWFASGGRNIDLAIIRKPASGSERIGSLVMNPGGPGEPGVEFLRNIEAMGTVPAELSKRFDLVAWDPRGSGSSIGIRCSTNAEMIEPDPLPYPATKTARDKVIAKDDAERKSCMVKEGDVLPYVATRQTTHDMDAIRAALGDQKLTYVGYSYGTALGLQYLQDFPGRVRAMVLDGVVTPGADPLTTTYRQLASFETNLTAFLGECKARSNCTFGGGDPRGALIRFLDQLQKGQRIPASYSTTADDGTVHDRRGTLGLTEALEGIIATMYNRSSWPMLETALTSATNSAAPDGRYLLSFRDQLEGRQADGSWNHSLDANMAISCADQAERATSDFGDVALITKWDRQLPFFGAFGAVGQPGCYGVPAARWPMRAPTTASLASSPPVVLVNSIHDPATPYSNAKVILGLLPKATLVTWEGEDHTSFAQGHSCIDDDVVPYLVELKMPSPDATCRAGGA